MSIITISRGSFSRGKEVAEKVAKQLGYSCISREILLEASELFNIPEMKLVRAIHDSPSILDRFTNGKEQYMAYIRAALLRHVQKDNVVYHGLAGHFFLQGIPHVLKVRIIANMNDRIQEEMKREHISAEKAQYLIKKDDDERRKWGQSLYGIDTSESSLYDMVLHIKTLNVDDVVKIILNTVELACFQTTTQSQEILDDLTLAAQVEIALIEEFPKVTVISKSKKVTIQVTTGLTMLKNLSKEKEITKRIEDIAINIGGAETVTVKLVHSISNE
ncbi:MAG: cytidylate kinase-like family protein [Desulfobacterales bacterium]|nr:cytidylate kinase-like family protein [Desulfobacterales bacterium]